MKDEKVTEIIDRMEAMRVTLVESMAFCDAYKDRCEQLERENKALREQLGALRPRKNGKSP